MCSYFFHLICIPLTASVVHSAIACLTFKSVKVFVVSCLSESDELDDVLPPSPVVPKNLSRLKKLQKSEDYSKRRISIGLLDLVGKSTTLMVSKNECCKCPQRVTLVCMVKGGLCVCVDFSEKPNSQQTYKSVYVAKFVPKVVQNSVLSLRSSTSGPHLSLLGPLKMYLTKLCVTCIVLDTLLA